MKDLNSSRHIEVTWSPTAQCLSALSSVPIAANQLLCKSRNSPYEWVRIKGIHTFQAVVFKSNYKIANQLLDSLIDRVPNMHHKYAFVCIFFSIISVCYVSAAKKAFRFDTDCAPSGVSMEISVLLK